jgi:hypothetical protein
LVICSLYQELPKRKQAVTQERSKVLKETEDNPFVDDEQEAAAKAARDARNASSSAPNLRPGPVHSLGVLRIRRRIKTRIKPRGSESLSTSRLKRIR